MPATDPRYHRGDRTEVTRVRMILRAVRGRAQGCAAPIATGRKPPSASPARNAAAVAGIARC